MFMRRVWIRVHFNFKRHSEFESNRILVQQHGCVIFRNNFRSNMCLYFD